MVSDTWLIGRSSMEIPSARLHTSFMQAINGTVEAPKTQACINKQTHRGIFGQIRYKPYTESSEGMDQRAQDQDIQVQLALWPVRQYETLSRVLRLSKFNISIGIQFK